MKFHSHIKHKVTTTHPRITVFMLLQSSNVIVIIWSANTIIAYWMPIRVSFGVQPRKHRYMPSLFLCLCVFLFLHVKDFFYVILPCVQILLVPHFCKNSIKHKVNLQKKYPQQRYGSTYSVRCIFLDILRHFNSISDCSCANRTMGWLKCTMLKWHITVYYLSIVWT